MELFLISHVTTIAYALVCPGDLVMAFIFLANAFACLTIIVIIVLKRRRYAARHRAAEWAGRRASAVTRNASLCLARL